MSSEVYTRQPLRSLLALGIFPLRSAFRNHFSERPDSLAASETVKTLVKPCLHTLPIGTTFVRLRLMQEGQRVLATSIPLMKPVKNAYEAKMVRKLIKRDSLGRRTDRVKNREVNQMRHLRAQGLTDAEIAVKLKRKPETIKRYLDAKLREIQVEQKPYEETPHKQEESLIVHGLSPGATDVEFLVTNISNNLLVVDRICVEIMHWEQYDARLTTGARIIDYKYKVQLSVCF